MKRYVDVDKILKLFDDAYSIYPNSYYNGICVAEKMIKNLANADSRELRCGTWVHIPHFWLGGCLYPGRFRCSQCGHYITVGQDRNYCPNCGAKMEDENDDKR